MIRSATTSDAAAICNIYNYYIKNSTCTFETEPVSIDEMQKRISTYTKNGIWIVFDQYPFNNSNATNPLLLNKAKKTDNIPSSTSKFKRTDFNKKILGYAYAKPWHHRNAYKFTLETSIYVSNNTEQKGIGTKLYGILIDKIKTTECHTLLGIVTLPNNKSVRLHEKYGFKKAAHLREVGQKFNKWLDVGFWELNLGKKIL
jgi:L-amino acid N-acyltransferase YncA